MCQVTLELDKLLRAEQLTAECQKAKNAKQKSQKVGCEPGLSHAKLAVV